MQSIKWHHTASGLFVFASTPKGIVGSNSAEYLCEQDRTSIAMNYLPTLLVKTATSFLRNAAAVTECTAHSVRQVAPLLYYQFPTPSSAF